jgi:stage II sporulation protein D
VGSGEKENSPVELSLLSSKGSSKALVTTDIYILSGKSGPQKADPNSFFLTMGKESVKVEPTIKGAGESKDKDEIILFDGSLVLTGVGYGHGVGMAQDGAIEMAKQGMSFLDILKFYYSGIEVY